ncbi:MAG TPA: DUF6537 domain-containing protein, partial [Tepidisphaeraceae bacterium]|nr:DUF6537 domain-containing protein [Tepidisphaeraceae bacterium]
QLLTNKTRILRKTRLFGRRASEQFEKLLNSATQSMPALSEESKYDLAMRVYDLLQYSNYDLARRYVDLIRGVYRRDSAEQRFAATREAIWGIAKVMLIKDEIYVSYLLTRYEKKHRDILKYGIDVANGDHIVYRHHTRPEFNIGKRRVRLNITTRDWMLNVVRRMKWVRSFPGWHRRETSFREWYIGLLDRLDLAHDYDGALKILRCHQDVSGYREIRYPKMDRAKTMVENELGNASKVEIKIRQDVMSGFRATARV